MLDITFHTLVANLDSIFPMVPIIYAAVYRKINGAAYYMLVFMIVQLILNTFATYKVYLDKDYNNIWMYQVNAFVSLIIISLFFYSINPLLRTKRSVVLMVAFMLLVGIYMLFEKTDAFNSISYSAVAIGVTFLSLYYYYYLIKHPDNLPIKYNASFFIVTGLFVYYSADTIIFLMYRLLTLNEDKTGRVGLLWLFHNFMFSVMALFITKGFACNISPKTR